ncbi:beta strand repeat-containing protein [Collimonas silvisoli]|uniref:beta strand repeat-containing protein n=1 Tax=Collimonas silvisoli TaxID=2825884 RepID=UPI001E3F6AEA|nr:hypothetical protein [Collimonas silvisoli]
MTELLNAQSPLIGTANPASGPLTLFAEDMAKLGKNGVVQSSPIDNAVISAAIEDYYWVLPPSGVAGATYQAFFNSVDGGVSFNLGDIAAHDSGVQLGRQRLVTAADQLIWNNDAMAEAIVASSNNWFVQAGSGGMSASGGFGGDYVMIGGASGNMLVGGNGSNVLIAGSGNDTLKGGKGTNYLQAGFANDWLYGQGINDKFEFTGISSSTDYIVDIGGKGTVWVGNTQLIGAVDATSSFTWTASDGTTYIYAPDSAGNPLQGAGTLTAGSGAIGGTGRVVFEHFDLNKAETDLTGFLGIHFREQSAVVAGTGSDPFASGNYAPTNAAVAAQGDVQGLTIYASAISDQAQTITLALAGGNGSQFAVNTGADLLSFSNGTVTLTIPAGADSVTVGLVYTGDPTQSQSVQLTSTLVGAANSNGNPLVSNALGVTFNAGPAPAIPTNAITGIVHPDNPSVKVYTGDGGDDLITTGSGQNSIIGGGGSDSIVGGSGNDTVRTGDGNSTIGGGGGQDIILVGNGSNQIYAGSAVSLSTAMSQSRAATASNQKGIFIGVGNGNNTIVGGTGNDAIFVGTGNNTIVAGPGSVTVVGGVETSGVQPDWSTTPSSTANSLGVVFHDVSYAAAPFNAPAGYDGSMVASAPPGTGNDTIFGGTGDSVFILSNGDNYVDAGGGNDQIWAGVGSNTIFGGAGNDTIAGGGGSIYIDAESGNDLIVADGGNATVFGGTGNDSIFSGDNTDNWATSTTTNNSYLEAGSGNTALFGTGGKDTLIGGSGTDSLIGGAGTEYLKAGSGNTLMDGGAGQDTLLGGAGNDVLNAGDGSTYAQAGSGATTITGGAGSDTLVAGSGKDSITAGSGNTTIIGGSGVDTIVGGTGNNSIDAGDGGDTSGATMVTAGSGNTTVHGGAGVDEIFGGSGANILYAGDGGTAGGATTVIAGTGNTTVHGGAGIDLLFGGAGTDILYAGDGGTAEHATSVTGGSGSDTLVAGAGTDLFFGGAGSATYVINGDSGNTTIVNSAASDTLQFGAGVSIADITANASTSSSGNAVTLTLNQGGSVTFDQGALSQATFADGTVATVAQLLSPAFAIGNTTYAAVNDVLGKVKRKRPPTQYLTLTGTADISGAGNNVNDVIAANAGNDTLIAGSANDTLIGGGASEVYVVSAAAGTVTTINHSSNADTLSFKAGVSQANLTVSTAAAADGSLIATLKNSKGGAVVIDGSRNGDMLDRIGFVDGSSASLGEMLAQLSVGPTAATSAVNVTLASGIQNMTLTGTANLSATGNARDDVITANTGHDTLIAGTGNDTLNGSGGIANYVVNAGDGNVVIRNSGSADTLTFGAGISKSNLVTSSAVVGGVTVVTIADNAGGSVTVQGGGLNKVSFADGSTVSLTQLLSPSYSDGKTGYSTVSTTAGAGIVTLNMTGSADVTAAANALNDTIQANSGNDTLIAGSGNDTLIGGGASDTYVIAAGTQVTTIEHSGTADKLRVGNGVSLANLSATAAKAADGSSIITIRNSLGGSVAIDASANGPLDQIGFANGGTASLSALLAQATTGITAATSAVDVTLGQGIQNMILTGKSNLTATGNDVDDVITANSGNDTLIAGSGNDTLKGGGGTATYAVNAGNIGNVVTISNSGSADTLAFGTGIALSSVIASSAVVNGETVVTLQVNGGSTVAIDNPAFSKVAFANGITTTLAALLKQSAPVVTADTTLGNSGGTIRTSQISGATDTAVFNADGRMLSDTTLIGDRSTGTYTQTTVLYNLNGTITTSVISANKGSGSIAVDKGTPVAFSTGQTPSVNAAGDIVITAPDTASDNLGGTRKTIYLSNGTETIVSNANGDILTEIMPGAGMDANGNKVPAIIVGNILSNADTAVWLTDVSLLTQSSDSTTVTTSAQAYTTTVSQAGGSKVSLLTKADGSAVYSGSNGAGKTWIDTFNADGTIILQTLNNGILSSNEQLATDGTEVTTSYYANGTTKDVLTAHLLDDVFDHSDYYQDGSIDGVYHTNADGSYTDTVYSDNGPVSFTNVTNADGSSREAWYDAKGTLTSTDIIAANGTGTTTYYNPDGSVSGSTPDPQWVVHLRLESPPPRPTLQQMPSTTTVLANGLSTTTNYYLSSSISSVVTTGPDGTVTHDRYTPNGMLSKELVTYSDGSTSNTSYYANGNKTSTTVRSAGSVRTSNYDGLGTLVGDSWQKPDGTSGVDTFHPGGSSSGWSSYPNGNYSAYTNDGLGKIVTTNYTPGSDGIITVPVLSSTNGVLAANIENVTLIGSFDLAVTGNSLNDTITGNAGNDTLHAGTGNDILRAGTGKDTLISGSGSDTLFGGSGSTTYVVNAGDGKTTIAQSGKADTLNFGAGITAGSITANSQVVNGATVLTLTMDGGNVVTITNPAFSQVDFADGSTTTLSALLAHTAASMTSATSIVMPAGKTNLTLTGSASISGTGNNLADVISANSGNDTLIAGSGLATLIGGSGNDTFVIDNPGDVIVEAANTGKNTEQTSVSTTLAAHVQNLTGIGSAALTLAGNNLANVITANSGADTLIAGSGIATLIGGSGNDTFVIDNASDVITKSANTGNNTEQTSVSATLAAHVQNLTGIGSGALALTGNNLANVITANNGDDTLVAGSGVATLVGGSGNDLFIVNNASDVINAQVGGVNAVQSSNSYTLGINQQNLTGTGTGNLVLTGNGLVNAITGNHGNDTLIAGSGVATLIGNSGNDTFVVDNIGDTVSELGSTGRSTVLTSVNYYVLPANIQNLTGTGSANLILIGNYLNDVITGNTGADTLVAGAGNDTLISGSGNDTLVAGSGQNTLIGGAGGDTFSGNAGTAAAGATTYVVNAGDGDIRINNSASNDVLEFGSGITSSSINASSTGTGSATVVTLTISGGKSVVINSPAFTRVSFADGTTATLATLLAQSLTAVASAVSIVMPATVTKLTLTGTASISGTGNSLADTIIANSGNDTLIAGSGVATLVGGAGNDTFVVNNAADVIQAKSTGTNSNAVLTSVSYVLPANVQSITGTGTGMLTLTGNTLDDVITANSGSDSLIGGSGTSILEGGAGNDHLTEASGNGVLLGGAGTDVITGGTGHNFIVGGTGNDTLTTGSGSNIIAFNKGDGQDVVTAAAGTNNTISLGGNFAYADLNLQKSGNNLILNMGTTEHITLQNWYAGSNKVTNLQVIDAAMSDFKHGSTDALRNSNVENFNFQALVTSFNQALAANPKLSSWALTNALLTDHLSSSDTTALGGDLAYSYGTRGSLTGMNVATAQSELSSAQFATAAQTLHPWGSVSGGAAQIR